MSFPGLPGQPSFANLIPPGAAAAPAPAPVQGFAPPQYAPPAPALVQGFAPPQYAPPAAAVAPAPAYAPAPMTPATAAARVAAIDINGVGLPGGGKPRLPLGRHIVEVTMSRCSLEQSKSAGRIEAFILEYKAKQSSSGGTDPETVYGYFRQIRNPKDQGNRGLADACHAIACVCGFDNVLAMKQAMPNAQEIINMACDEGTRILCGRLVVVDVVPSKNPQYLDHVFSPYKG